MACKRSGVRISLAPLLEYFPRSGAWRAPGPDLRAGLIRQRPRWGAVLSVQVMGILGPDGGLLRVRQAGQAAWPLRASRRSRRSGTALRSAPWRIASSPASDGEPPREHAATTLSASPEIPRAVLHAGQVPVRRPLGARVTDCLALPGAAFPGDLLSWRSSEVTARCLRRDEALTRGRSCRSLLVAQIVPGRFLGIGPSASD
jgi:hypothetical protein